MKFTLDRTALLAAMTTVSGSVAKTTIPIIGNVLILANGSAVTFRATNLNMETATSAPSLIETPGSITVPATTLREIAQNMAPGSDAVFSMGDDDPRLSVSSGRSRFKLPTLPVRDFPTMETIPDGVTFDIPARELAALLTRVSFAASQDVARAILTATLLFTHDGLVSAVASNSHKLSFAATGIATEIPNTMLPPAFVSEAVRLLDIDGDVTVRIAPGKIRIEVGETALTSKLIDGEPLGYMKVVPAKQPHALTVSSAAMQLAARRAMITATDKSRSVMIDVLPGAMKMAALSDASAEAGDEIEIEYDGPEFKTRVNGAYLLEVLARTPSETVRMEFNTPKAALTFTADGDASGLMVLMPMTRGA